MGVILDFILAYLIRIIIKIESTSNVTISSHSLMENFKFLDSVILAISKNK